MDKISRILKTTHKVVVRASGGNSALTSSSEGTAHVIDWLRERKVRGLRCHVGRASGIDMRMRHSLLRRLEKSGLHLWTLMMS